MSVDAVFLDFGNVLVFHDNALLFRNLARAAAIDEAQVLSRLNERFWDNLNRGTLRGPRLYDELRTSLSIDLDDASLDAAFCSHFTPHHAVLPLVERLAAHVPLFLLSNTCSIHFEYLRPRFPVLDHFTSLVLSYEVGATKPESAIYERALAVAGVPPARTAFFDDVHAYVAGAQRHGIQGRIFTTATAFAHDLDAMGFRVR